MNACVCSGTELRLISLFDGIAGFPLAFSRAGVRTIATVEIDKAAAGVAAAHFPEAEHFADITEVTPDDLLGAGFCPVHGIVSAGWPCTDLSLAGLRLGLGGARSGLVGEVFRLLTGLRPRWFVLENVPGLLSSVCPCPGGGICEHPACAAGPHSVRGGACGRSVRSGRPAGSGRCMALHGGGMGTVLRSLVECGYGVAYRVLDAQHFGVPQRRRRVVIVGRLGDAAGPGEVLLEPARGAGDSPARGAARPRVADRTVVSTLAGGGQRGYRVDAESAAGNQQLVAGGGPVAYAQQGTNVGPAGALRTGGNHTNGVPFFATTLTAREGKSPDSDATTTLTPLGREGMRDLTAEGSDASEDGTGRGTPLVPVAYALRADPAGVGQGHNTNYVPVDLAQVTSGMNRSNPRAGDPAGSLAATSRPAVAFNETAGGNSVHSNVTPPVKTETGGGATSVAAAAVRRLTPVECERLQGFPDRWTGKRFDLRREGNRWAVLGGAEQADSPRYRQLGNSIAVPVFDWVAGRIVRTDRGEAL